MIKRLLLALLLLVGSVCSTKATVLTGTFKNPDGSLVNGNLTILLPSITIQNICSSPYQIVPTTPVTIPIINGVLTNSPSIVSQDCMSKFTLYRVQVLDSVRGSLGTWYWYVANVTGSFIYPSIGNKYLYDVGMGRGPAGPLVYIYPSVSTSDLQVATTATGTLTPLGTATVTVSWNLPYADINYTVVCVVVPLPASVQLSVTAIGTPTFATNQISVTVHNNDGSNSWSGTVSCRGKHQ